MQCCPPFACMTARVTWAELEASPALTRCHRGGAWGTRCYAIKQKGKTEHRKKSQAFVFVEVVFPNFRTVGARNYFLRELRIPVSKAVFAI